MTQQDLHSGDREFLKVALPVVRNTLAFSKKLKEKIMKKTNLFVWRVVAAVLVWVASHVCSLGGAEKHGLICASFSGKIYRLDAAGEVLWEYKTPAAQCGDMAVLESGNILFVCGKAVYEMTPEREIVFQFTSKNGLFGCQRLPDGTTFVCESASGRLILVNPQGHIVRETTILDQCPKKGAPNHYLRNARVLENGHFLVAHYSGKKVCEYTGAGEPVFEIPVPGGAYSANRLANGNTLISVADKAKDAKLIEVDSSGKIVWEFSNRDIKDERFGVDPLRFMTGLQRLPDGTTIAVQWLGHGHLGKFPYIFEITPDKRVVRALRIPGDPGTLTAVQVVDEQGKPVQGVR
jgi:hypothetical protein